jgi:hypothetical protein
MQEIKRCGDCPCFTIDPQDHFLNWCARLKIVVHRKQKPFSQCPRIREGWYNTKSLWTYVFYWRESNFKEPVEIATKLANRILYIQNLLHSGNYVTWWMENEGKDIASLFNILDTTRWPDIQLDEETCYKIRTYFWLCWKQGKLRMKQHKYLKRKKHLKINRFFFISLWRWSF